MTATGMRDVNGSVGVCDVIVTCGTGVVGVLKSEIVVQSIVRETTMWTVGVHIRSTLVVPPSKNTWRAHNTDACGAP